jgi:type II secretory pathway component GspD/PulD (secretin)
MRGKIMKPRQSQERTRKFLATVLKGHNFSRAGIMAHKHCGFSRWGTFLQVELQPSGPKGRTTRQDAFTARLKPCPFKARGLHFHSHAIAFTLVLLASALPAQTAAPAAPPGQSTAAPAGQSAPQGDVSAAAPVAAPDQETSSPRSDNPQPRSRDRRLAAKLYLDASKLFLDRQFEEAMKDFEQAAALDPTNTNYRLAIGVARNHAVTALIQDAAKDRLLNNEAAARVALERARALDPTNIEVNQHLDELADDARSQPHPLYEQSGSALAGPVQLETTPGMHSFHLHADRKQIILQVFRTYGLTAMLDTSVQPFLTRFDVDDASFEQAARVLSLDTDTFFVPLDAHRALVAADTTTNRNQFLRQDEETVYLTGLSDDELNDVLSVAKNIFLVQQATLSLGQRAVTLRAPQRTLEAFNATLESLLEGRSQVLLDVRLIQVAHTSDRNIGAQLPQSIAAFNVYAEEQSILNSNASLVQQIISSGLASPNDPLAILGILIASGQVTSPLLSSGFALFGGGITQSALVPGSATFNLSLNSSDSRELDQLQLRLEDGEKGEIKLGEKYPIQTSSFSSLSGSVPNIPGLTGAGTSGSLGSLLSSLTSTVPNIPMVQYQDLGLTLTVTPKALRNGDVALNLEMKLDALAGTSIDGNPVLNHREYTGTVTLKEGEATVVATEMDKSQSQAISGTPGLSEIPGLNNVTEKDLQKNYATLVIVMTPHLVSGPQAAGHTAMMRVEKSAAQ